MKSNLRIPFADAIQEKGLLRDIFDVIPGEKRQFMSTAQKAWLKIIYGAPLSEQKDKDGWSERDFWAASQGSCKWDELGYLKSIAPLEYVPREYREAWGVAGIRSGKSDRLAATIVAYEAVCGGHEEWGRKGKPVMCLQIAQDTRLAKYSLHSIRQTLESMPFVGKYQAKGSMITNITADTIELKNGVVIMVIPPTIKAIRGYDSPVAVMDEVGVWYQNADSANPDFQIYSQVSSRQAQFEFPKIVGVSSPWNRAGILFQRYEAGTNGAKVHCPSCRALEIDVPCEMCEMLRRPHSNRVVLHGTTASSNPLVTRAWLRDELQKDPRAFERECLATFQDSVSGFLSSALIERAKSPGVTKRSPEPRFHYIAAIDPAFRRDAFAFTIVHADQDKGIVQDFAARWQDPSGVPLNPAEIFQEISDTLSEYGIKGVFSDQYTLEALQYIANQHNFTIQEVTFSAGSKAEIYGNLQQLLNQGRLVLLDHSDTLNELKTIEKRNSQGGQVRISAPEGLYDDCATVMAIAAREAVWMLPKAELVEKKPPTMIEQHLNQLGIRKQIASRGADYDW